MAKGVSFRRFEDLWTARAEPRKIGFARESRSFTPASLFPSEVTKLLEEDLSRAEQRARRALETHPLDPEAKFLLGASLQRQGRSKEACEILDELTRSHPEKGSVWRELGMARQKLGAREGAIDAYLIAVDAVPIDRASWRGLGALMFADREDDASEDDLSIVEARSAYREERLKNAETILRPFVDAQPGHIRALILLGDILDATGRWKEASTVFERCLSLVPDCLPAQFRLACMLLSRNQYPAALREIEKLLKFDPGSGLYRHMKAIVLGGGLQLDRAIPIYEQLLSEFPDRAGLWGQYVMLLRLVRPDDAVGVYQEMLRRFPQHAVVYYNLASVKSFHFDDSWPDRILALLDRPDLSAESRVELHFVLGKAFEDLKQYAKSFEHYRASNDLLFESRPPGAEARMNPKWQSKWVYTRSLFSSRAGTGSKDTGPIFIVGVPRSGSTLVDQILSSHSAIEGLEELEDLPAMVEQELDKDSNGNRGSYPRIVRTLNAERLRSLGEKYMARTRRRRKSSKPFFTDKALINFQHVGLIHLILPNAKIIDTRRHPLDCCFSCYKHYFPTGQPQTWDQGTMGRSYVDYVELMAHFDQLLPGRVHRVIYERLVENPEEEVRRLLDYIGVPFEEQCLRFHETKRFVRTISSEQVKMPLYKSGIAQWKNYEPWLGPLKEALGCVLEFYPDVPQFFPRLRSQSSSYELGAINEFRLVKGVRQRPFENAPLPS